MLAKEVERLMRKRGQPSRGGCCTCGTAGFHVDGFQVREGTVRMPGLTAEDIVGGPD